MIILDPCYKFLRKNLNKVIRQGKDSRIDLKLTPSLLFPYLQPFEDIDMMNTNLAFIWNHVGSGIICLVGRK